MQPSRGATAGSSAHRKRAKKKEATPTPNPGKAPSRKSQPVNPLPTTSPRPFGATYSPHGSDILRRWLVIDASDVVLGRLASQAAQLLRGKHKPTFARHIDTGDFVVIVNAERVAVHPNKRRAIHYRHSGRPGGLSRKTTEDLLETSPTKLVEIAVRGMLPKNSLGRAQLKKLKVYAGPTHPHAAQNPEPFEIKQVSQ